MAVQALALAVQREGLDVDDVHEESDGAAQQGGSAASVSAQHDLSARWSSVAAMVRSAVRRAAPMADGQRGVVPHGN